MIKIFNSIFILTFFISCKEKSEREDQTLRNDIISTLRVDDSFTTLHDTVKREPYLRQLESKLNLEKISNGYDSLQIRIWFMYASVDTIQAVVLKYNDKEVDNKLYAIKGNLSKTDFDIKAINTQSLKSDKETFLKLIQKLKQLNLFSLVSSSDVSGYPYIAGGDKYIIEVTIGKTYRMISYTDPDLTKHKFIEARKFISIIQLLEKDLGFKRLKTYEFSNNNVDVPIKAVELDSIIED